MELENIIKKIENIDYVALKESQKHWLDVAKPLLGLGKLEQIISQIAGIKGNAKYSLDKKAVIVMCADNGVVEEGVSQTGQNMTAVVSKNFLVQKTSVCIMSQIANADVFPIDIGIAVDIDGLTDKNIKVAYGTKNMAKEPAMTREETIKAIKCGIEKVAELKEKGYEIIATGEMGIGNTTTSSAIVTVLLGVEVESVTGRGAGLSKDGIERKIRAIKKAIEINKPNKNDPIDILSKVGGLDIAGLMGVFIGGALYRIPIVIDGFISGVSALLAVKMCSKIKNYIIASHISKEPAGQIILKELGLSAIIDADMSLGEGTGAVALFPLIDMAYSVYNKMHTFRSLGCGEKYQILK